MYYFLILSNRCCKWQDSNITSPFDGYGDLPLMLCTVARNPPRNDLSPFRNKISKDSRILIFNIQFFVGAESTDLSLQERSLLPVRSWLFSRFSHAFSPLVTDFILTYLLRRSFSSSIGQSSMAITSVRVLFLPSGVCHCR